MSVVESHKNYDPRLRIFYYIIAVMVLLLLGGLARLQLFDSVKYSEQEKQQNQRRVLFPGTRGNIYDREGRLMVANQPRFSAVIYLAELRPEFRREYLTLMRQYRTNNVTPPKGRSVEVEARAAVVQRYLDQVNEVTGRDKQIDPQELDRHFRFRLLLPYPLIEDVEKAEFAKIIEQIPLDSKIQLHTTSVRHYPHGQTAAHLLGYVSSTDELPEFDLPGEQLMTFNIHGSTGKSGLEKSFNDRLQGKTGSEIWIVDPSGYRYGKPVERHPPVQGDNLVTSIDLEIQNIAEQALGDLRKGAVIALDANTGEVLALASGPTYDLNDLSPYIPSTVFQKINEEGGWFNRAVQGTYAPGSIFKIISAIAALKVGAITPETTSNCTGTYRVGNRTFPCHSRAGHGEVNLAESLRVSCNVFYYEHSQDTRVEAIANEARQFGLHEKTGIELPSESSRMVVPDREYKREVIGESWYPGDTANLSIGQGFLRVTPLQMATFAASLARRETSTQPTLLRHVPGKTPLQRSAPIDLPAEQLDALIAGMEAAAEDGTARFAGMENVRVAGKTGTAQVRTAEGTLHLAWFIGFAPIEDPKVALAIVVEGTDVQDNYAGGTTAAPIAREVLEKYFEKNPVPPPPEVAARDRWTAEEAR